MPFKTLHQALCHSFHPSVVVQLASVEREYRSSGDQTPGSSRVTPMERVAEAAMIRIHVNNVPVPERYVIEARYAPPPANIIAVRRLTEHVLPKLAGLNYRHMVHLLVMRYFGVAMWVPKGTPIGHVLKAVVAGRAKTRMDPKKKKRHDDSAGEWSTIKLTALAEVFKIHPNTLTAKRKIVDGALKGIRERAFDQVWDELEQAGHIGERQRVETRGPIERAAAAKVATV